MKAKINLWMVLAAAVMLIAGLGVAQVITQDWNSARLGTYGTGTAFKVMELHNLAFVNDTTSTATTNVSGTYYLSVGWKSSSADYGKATAAISGGVLTVTSAAATTGTCSVIVFGGA